MTPSITVTDTVISPPGSRHQEGGPPGVVDGSKFQPGWREASTCPTRSNSSSSGDTGHLQPVAWTWSHVGVDGGPVHPSDVPTPNRYILLRLGKGCPLG